VVGDRGLSAELAMVAVGVLGALQADESVPPPPALFLNDLYTECMYTAV
jgi:hypothetical protein